MALGGKKTIVLTTTVISSCVLAIILYHGIDYIKSQDTNSVRQNKVIQEDAFRKKEEVSTVDSTGHVT